MKANELRIGNIIGSIHTDITWKVDLFLFNEIFDDQTYLDHLKPIPLTEEWLLKFGFEKKKGYYDRYYYSIDGMDIRIDGDMFETEVGECLYKSIKYVHQLQNLFFAHNDQELTMK